MSVFKRFDESPNAWYIVLLETTEGEEVVDCVMVHAFMNPSLIHQESLFFARADIQCKKNQAIRVVRCTSNMEESLADYLSDLSFLGKKWANNCKPEAD